MRSFPFVSQIERDIWIPADGAPYELNTPPQRTVLSEEGTGMPPINYVSQRGPYQHGETLRDFFLTPRTVQLIVRHNYCSRSEYWAGRSALLDILRPNRSSLGQVCQGVLRKVLPDGTKRDLSCAIQQGPTFAPRQTNQWDELAYTETLRFTAFDPTYFDPDVNTISNQLDPIATFPMTFPVSFTGFNFSNTEAVTGTWLTYPTITITGPCSSVIITNVTTGQVITFTYPVPFGSIVTMDLTYGHKTVTLDDGTNLIGYVSTDSDLAQFQLIPGTNVITMTAQDTGSSTIVRMSYYNRYVGI